MEVGGGGVSFHGIAKVRHWAMCFRLLRANKDATTGLDRKQRRWRHIAERTVLREEYIPNGMNPA